MDLKLGYKQTEVGVIPEEWEVCRLRDLAQIRSGIAKNANSTVIDPIRVDYLRVANVQDGFLDLSEMSQIEISRSNLQRFSVLPGDLLMNEGGDRDALGRGSIWRGEFDPCVHQNHVFVVRCGRSAAPEYVTLWSASPTARKYFFLAGKQTTNLASINKTSLGELPVVVPRMSEQRMIAEALSDVDGLLAGLDRLIAKKRDLKQAAMQQLLTGETRLPGFHGEWEVKSVRDLGNIQTGPFGTLLKAEEYSGSDGVPLISVGEVGAGRFKISEHTPRVPKKVIRRLPQYVLRTGDIVFGRKGAVDRSALVSETEDGWFLGSDGIRLRPHDECHPRYLAWQFQRYDVQAWLLQNAIGTTMASLNQGILNRVQIPYAPFPEQTAIAGVLSEMDVEIATLEARREKTRAMKKGMMQELLTGRIRLI